VKRILILILWCATATAWSQPIHLSPSAEISIITLGPWQGELYAAFGHTAIRVHDPLNGVDDAYNYGVFDFNQPNFYLNYTRGLLYFKLGVYAYPDFRDYYIYYNRSVTEQVLNLNAQEKQAIYTYLEWNAQPGNETYRYDYFYNNCSSRVRDVIAQVLGNNLKFDYSFITGQKTIRELTDLCLTQQPWGDLGIDICLGLPMDKTATPYEYMFLPDYLEQCFDHATIRHDSVSVPAVRSKIEVFTPRPEEAKASLIHPWWVMGGVLLFMIGLSVYDWRRKKVSVWFDGVLFPVLGLLGVLLFVLWVATDHQAAANNFNLLWAIPFHLIAILVFRKSSRPWLRRYFTGVAVFMALLIVTWVFLPQDLHEYLLPLVAGIGIRAEVLSRLL